MDSDTAANEYVRESVLKLSGPGEPHDDKENSGEGCEKHKHVIKVVEIATAELAIAYSSSFVLWGELVSIPCPI